MSINAPAGQVYDYVADFTRHGEWSGHGLQVTKSTEGPVAVGSSFSTMAKQFGTQREQSTVTELSPGSAFAWESTGALGRARHRFSLAGDGGKTTLSKSAEIVEPTFLAKLTNARGAGVVGPRIDRARGRERRRGEVAQILVLRLLFLMVQIP